MEKDTGKKAAVFCKGWLYSIFIALIIATSFKSAIADWNVVPTGSMKPTIIEGDRIFVNKLAYDLKIPYTTRHITEWGDPERGEIVVFFSPVDNVRLVKRVIGVPGDTVAMIDNRLILNGRPLRYELLDTSGEAEVRHENLVPRYYLEDIGGRKHPVKVTPFTPAMRSFGPITVPPGRYFVMGDNRDRSADSRSFGFVDRRLIVGRASAVVLSLDIDNYRPRWERSFKRLP